MTWREFRTWSAYEALTGPLGPERADYQAALVAHVVANAAPRKKGAKPYKLDQFLLKWDRGPDQDDAPETPEEQRARVMRMLGGTPKPETELLGPDGRPIDRKD